MIEDRPFADMPYYTVVKIKPRCLVAMDHSLYGMLCFIACFFIFCFFLGTEYGDMPSNIIDRFFLPVACGAIPSIIVAWLIEKANRDTENKRLAQMRLEMLSPFFMCVVNLFTIFAQFSQKDRKILFSDNTKYTPKRWEQWVEDFCMLSQYKSDNNDHRDLLCRYQDLLFSHAERLRRETERINTLSFHLINTGVISSEEESALYRIESIVSDCSNEYGLTKNILDYVAQLKEEIDTFDDYKCLNDTRYNRWIRLSREDL